MSLKSTRQSGARRIDSREAKAVARDSQASERKTVPLRERGVAHSKQIEYAFINLPFHKEYETTLLALISGLTAFGLVPQLISLETRSEHRLLKLIRMLQRSTCSFHDVSYMLRDGRKRVPRFNMPFELGLAVGIAERPTWFVLERQPYRLQQSLSDLNGIDPLVYGGTDRGIHQVLLKAFDRLDGRITVDLIRRVNSRLRDYYPGLKREYGPAFSGPCFRRLVYLAAGIFDDEKGKHS